MSQTNGDVVERDTVSSSRPAETEDASSDDLSAIPQPPPSSPPPPMFPPASSLQTSNSGESSYHSPHHYLSSASSSANAKTSPIITMTMDNATKSATAQPRRDRFPSFDSVASSGSVVRHLSPANRQQPQQQLPLQPQPQPNYPLNPHLLPYHERKKLQQRQQSKQPQAQPPYPHPMMMMHQPPPYGLLGNTSFDPQAAAAFHQMYGFSGSPHHPPPTQGFMMPLPPTYHSQQQQQQNPQQQQKAPPLLQPYPMPFYQSPPTTSSHAPNIHPKVSPYPTTPGAKQDQRSTKSIIDTTKKVQPLSMSNVLRRLPQHHRVDSTGSMSSLGSTVAATGEEPADDRKHQSQGSSGSGNFFVDMIYNMSPKSATSDNSPNINDFHRANQHFLKKKQPQTAKPYSNESSLPKEPIHRRIGSQDRPPASRGTHKRLSSITNDDWIESDGDNQPNKTTNVAAGPFSRANSSGGEATSSVSGNGGGYSSSDMTEDEREYPEANERTSLLPPPGISTNERGDSNSGSSHNHRHRRKKSSRSTRPKQSYDSHGQHASSSRRSSNNADALLDPYISKKSRKTRKKKHKSRRKHSHRYHNIDYSSGDTSDSSYDYRRWTMKRARMLEKDRAKVYEQWRAEYMAESLRVKRKEEENRWYRRLFISFKQLGKQISRLIMAIEMFIANLPVAIGAVAMAVATLGVVWFKFTEENLDSCERVRFHSSQCTFPEFPGCFYCDTSIPMYKVALNFHYGCNITAGFLASLFIAKVILATRVVVDEMASPITASPAGLICMTTVCVFAGHGLIGQVMVSLAASVHLGLVIWYIYMALAYQIMPEPTWFPNTIGVGLSAVKTWLYYPMPGHLLMAISLSLNIFFFPISLIRVAINKKISATVGWMQMSAPAISLYALTIMAQPSFEEENPDVTSFQRVHRMIYLPCMHFMCALSIVGFIASCHSLWARWDDFKKKPFSPAHSAFCFPTLSHANAIQAYRGAVLTFGNIHSHDWRLVILYVYWFTVLVAGTVATFWISSKFLYRLPQWTNLDLADEDEPPAPSETILSMQEMITAGETMKQSFVSPAILQANETGALVLTRSGPGGTLKYVRTRRLPALGFEPTMNWSEMEQERELLLEFVVKHPPRRRHRTLSVPGIDFGYGSSLGTGNSGIYGDFSPIPPRRARADSGWL